MEEQLCRVEINKDPRRDEFVAKVFSDYEGVREFRSRNLEHLLRELTVELEVSYGEAVRSRGTETPPNIDEEGGFVDEDKF